jgi:hypothetical protein
MLDQNALKKIVDDQVAAAVDARVIKFFTSDEWLAPLEEKIIAHAQEHVLKKFSSSGVIPEVVSIIQEQVAGIIEKGSLPGIQHYIDPTAIKVAVDQGVEDMVQFAIADLGRDPAWLARIEHMLNQTVTHRTLATLGLTDINTIVHQRVDENMNKIRTDFINNFASSGIADQATENQLSITDQVTAVKNHLVTGNLEVSDSISVRNLSVLGSINVDNTSWDGLVTHISQRTLDALSDQWREQLVSNVTDQIQEHGIEFDQVSVGGNKLIDGNQLSRAVTESSLQSVGVLKTLDVRGETHINNNTLNVLNRRLGVNTESPEMALSVWDEEVSVVVGKNKANEAYIGTNRDQGVVIGVNREPQIEINTDGLTRIKQLQIGLHKISHATQVPGWSGTRGDMVFNSSPGSDRVFAWVCLGAYRWQTLKSAE